MLNKYICVCGLSYMPTNHASFILIRKIPQGISKLQKHLNAKLPGIFS